MKQYLSIGLMALFIYGCSSKSTFEQGKYLESLRELQHTEVIHLYTKEGDILLRLVIGYLNEAKYERFIVTLIGDAPIALEDTPYRFLLNQQKPIEIQKLPKSSQLLKKRLFKDSWGSSYLVTFASTKEKKLTFIIKEDKAVKQTRIFSKVPKYLLKSI